MLPLIMNFITSAPGAWLLAQATADDPGAGGADPRRVQAMSQLLLWLFLLVLLFLVASLIILRTSRRFRATLEHRRATPTNTEDVWAMHRLPDGAVEAIPEDPTEDPAEDDDDDRS